MNQELILRKIETNELTAYEALKKLYPEKKVKPGRRAFFIKMNIKVPEEGKGVNTFLKILFIIPIPILFAKIGLRIANRFMRTDEVDFKEIAKMLKYSKNSVISIESDDAIIDIKIV